MTFWDWRSNLELAMAERITEAGNNSLFGGWVNQGDGWFTPARNPEVPENKDFEKHAEISRARWDLGEYIKVRIQQLLHK